MDKVAMYRDAIFEEALTKMAKEKKEKRPNSWNASKMVRKESLKEYGQKERVKNFGKTMGGAIAGGLVGGALGAKVGNKVTNKMALKGKDAMAAMVAGGLTSATIGNAGQFAGAAIAGKEGKRRLEQAELNAAKKLANKYYGDNERIKAIATKKPNRLLGGSYANNLVNAERAYKKEIRKNK